jgi:hypothetical protein
MNPNFVHLGVGVYYDEASRYGFYWTNNFGSGTSPAVDDVVPLIVTTAAPRIEGTPTVGKKLTAKPGSWGPKGVKLSYQWYRAGKKIKKATAKIR